MRFVVPFLASFCVLFQCGFAIAHDRWSNGAKVPEWVKHSCCGEADAHMLSPAQVHQTDDDWLISIPESKESIVIRKIVNTFPNR